MNHRAPAQPGPMPTPIVLSKAERWARGVRSDLEFEVGPAHAREQVSALSVVNRNVLRLIASKVADGQTVANVEVAWLARKSGIARSRLRQHLNMLFHAGFVGKIQPWKGGDTPMFSITLLMDDFECGVPAV